MPPQSTIDIIDIAKGGSLAPRIRAWAAEGLSVTAIAYRLHDEGIDVDPRTVKRWINRDQNGDAA